MASTNASMTTVRTAMTGAAASLPLHLLSSALLHLLSALNC